MLCLVGVKKEKKKKICLVKKKNEWIENSVCINLPSCLSKKKKNNNNSL